MAKILNKLICIYRYYKCQILQNCRESSVNRNCAWPYVRQAITATADQTDRFSSLRALSYTILLEDMDRAIRILCNITGFLRCAILHQRNSQVSCTHHACATKSKVKSDWVEYNICRGSARLPPKEGGGGGGGGGWGAKTYFKFTKWSAKHYF
jgi:hypothetical protein